MTPAAAAAPPAATLDHWLEDFRDRFNANPRAAKLTAGWDRQLLVDATDSARAIVLTVAGARITDIRDGPPAREEATLVTMSAEQATLIEIFAGRYNPSAALIDGQLEVYSDARDKVKLEALAMVIWGV